jgi:hypothetical protein
MEHNTMSTLKKRTRLAAVATATLTGASIFALAAPAHANAVPPDVVPALGSKAVGGTNKITVTWNRANSGEPATSYVVIAYKHDPGNPPTYIGAPVKTVIVLDETNDGIANPPTSATVDELPAGLYQILIFANNAFGSSPGRQPVNYVWADGIEVKDPVVAPPAPVEMNYRAYRPYGSWDEMIKKEYRLYTAFSPSGGAIGGREPRLDELTFWRYALAIKPFEGWEWANYAKYYTAREAYLWHDPDGDPTMAPHAPADTNGDGVIDVDEADAAAILADDWAQNDVLFDRREVFLAWLAEESEQTTGPAYRLYGGFFARNPDFGGLAFWSTGLRTGWNLLGVSEFFVDSDEFVERYGEYETFAPEGPATDAAEFVALIYANILDRDPDGSGFSFWTRQLQTERMGPAEVMIGFTESEEYKMRKHVRVAAGTNYAHLLGRVPTEAEYVLHEFYWEAFWTNPTWAWPDSFVFDPVLGVDVPRPTGFEIIVDSAEYKARATA